MNPVIDEAVTHLLIERLVDPVDRLYDFFVAKQVKRSDVVGERGRGGGHAVIDSGRWRVWVHIIRVCS